MIVLIINKNKIVQFIFMIYDCSYITFMIAPILNKKYDYEIHYSLLN